MNQSAPLGVSPEVRSGESKDPIMPWYQGVLNLYFYRWASLTGFLISDCQGRYIGADEGGLP